MAIIGKGVVGKSSLANSFFNYKGPKVHDQTIEGKFKTNIVVNENLYNIEIVDTLLEEDYQNMIDMLMNIGQGFMLVFSLNELKSFQMIKLKGKVS